MLRPSPLAKSVLRLLRDDWEDFVFTRFHASHSGGVHIWIANQAYGIDINGIEGSVGYWDKRRIWKAVQHAWARKLGQVEC